MPRYNNGINLCALISIPLWLLVNVADAWWIYFYVQGTVNPVPHTAVNHSASAWTGYKVMMWMFGFVWGVVNMCMAWTLLATTSANSGKGVAKFLWVTFLIFVGIPLAILVTIMPFFGPWIVVPIVQRQIWIHGCDNYPMMVILDAKSTDDARYVVNVAYFFDNTPTFSPTHLFTYEITNPDDGDVWLFSLRTWDSPQSDIPTDMYPTLQQVYYDFVDDSLSGNCTLRNPISPLTNTTTLPCMTGHFDPGNHLSFDVSSSVPLNTTFSTEAQSVPVMNASLGIHDNDWDYAGEAPAARLQEKNEDGSLGFLVLKTTVQKPSDITELKVCVAGPEGREGGTVSAEVFAPLGLMLMRQADYALDATSDNNSD